MRSIQPMLKKCISLFFLLMVFFVFDQQTKEKTPIFIFDIHGVLMNIDKKQLIFTALNELFHQPTLFFRIPILIKKSFKKDFVNEPFLLKIYNCQKPCLSIIKLVEKLKNNGYKVYIFSNIRNSEFDDLNKKFSEVFQLFDGICTMPDARADLQKPLPGAYHYCKEMLLHQYGHSPDNNLFVFIDDSLKNIKAAKQYDFYGIRYTSPMQLKKKLEPWLFGEKIDQKMIHYSSVQDLHL